MSKSFRVRFSSALARCLEMRPWVRQLSTCQSIQALTMASSGSAQRQSPSVLCLRSRDVGSRTSLTTMRQEGLSSSVTSKVLAARRVCMGVGCVQTGGEAMAFVDMIRTDGK
ncbi:uncharacterized protein PG986_011347 [Apiospora aurea]|uniref:Uncharacterized protein n=1 Tax=Apiospora aurea TaxID=335848 RepID=A0ABR1Q4T9_9PEZI